MTTAQTHGTSSDQKHAVYDVIQIGAGLTGIHMLYRLREQGLKVRVLEAGKGVGGTWFWNRYPRARFDSQSYVYAYFFSGELLDEWKWSEQFAGQPEIERYLNYVVDKFSLREDIQLDSRVASASYDPEENIWTVTTTVGEEFLARKIITAVGNLSDPYFPAIPGRENFRGVSHHTGLWPEEPVDFKGKRVAVIGTGSSGVQLIPAIAEEAASLTVYQRTANWCLPLNNAPITDEEQVEIRKNAMDMWKKCMSTFSGFHYPDGTRLTFDDDKAARWAFYEEMWAKPGFESVYTNYADLATSKEANKEFCEFIAGKIRSIVKDPATAETLVPNDHAFGSKRPPMVTNYFETYNRENVELVDLKKTPITRVTETGLETAEGLREFDVVIWATGFDAVVGSLLRMEVDNGKGLTLREYWAEGPRTYLGIAVPHFPNFFMTCGPQAVFGNVPRSTESHVEFLNGLLKYSLEHGFDRVEATESAEEAWGQHVEECAAEFVSAESSWYVGTNIPGRKAATLLYFGGIAGYIARTDEIAAHDYEGFSMAKVDELPRFVAPV